MAQRRNYQDRGKVTTIKEDHPTGATNVIASGFVALAASLGWDLSVEAALAIVSAATVIASYLSPRWSNRR